MHSDSHRDSILSAPARYPLPNAAHSMSGLPEDPPKQPRRIVVRWQDAYSGVTHQESYYPVTSWESDTIDDKGSYLVIVNGPTTVAEYAPGQWQAVWFDQTEKNA